MNFSLQKMPNKHYIDLATKDLQRWNDILKITGAALKPKKCTYHFLKYTFILIGITLTEGDIFDIVISIQYTDNTPREKFNS